MSITKDPSGKRSIQVEVEVPGTPEEVWAAIATGPGVSSWFMPSSSDRKEGESPIGTKTTTNFGPGMDSVATVTAWDPPRRFAAESAGLGPKAPPLATEWSVEARAGGTCVVRVVHSLFADTDDWDNQLSGVESGWPGFFRVLKLYLTHFSGQPSAAIRLFGFKPGTRDEAWKDLSARLEVDSPDFPRYTAALEQSGEGKNNVFALYRLTEPAPGILSILVNSMRDKAMVLMTFYFYGDKSAEVVSRDTAAWHAWMSRYYPMA